MQRKMTDLAVRNTIWGTFAAYKRIDTEKDDRVVMVSDLNVPVHLRIFDSYMSSLTGREEKFKQELSGLATMNFLKAIDVKQPTSAVIKTKISLLRNKLDSKYGKNLFVGNFSNSNTIEKSQELAVTYVDECIKGVIDIFGSNENYNKVVSKNLEELSMDFVPNSPEYTIIQEYKNDLINASGENYSITNNESDSSIRTR